MHKVRSHSAVCFSHAGPAPVVLGVANVAFRMLAKAGISNTGGTAITGDIGVSPAAASTITGFALSLDGSGQFSTSTNVSGKVYAADYSPPTPANMTAAISAMQAAYVDAAGRVADFTDPFAGDLGGQTLVPGVYKFTGGLLCTSNCTFSGGAGDTWIIQVASTMDLATATSMLLSGGALAKNIVWAIAGATTLHATSSFKGILLDLTSVAMQNGAAMEGYIGAQTAITLINNAVTPAL